MRRFGCPSQRRHSERPKPDADRIRKGQVPKMTILDFRKRKTSGLPISMVTSYDAWSARIIADSDVDCILVGDSAAMVMHGHASTVPASTSMMAAHISAARRGAPEALIIGDLPFLSVRMGLPEAVRSIAALMRAGANAVKLEGAEGNLELITHIVQSGVPVMGHLGLIPQSINAFGGYRVQGRGEVASMRLLDNARSLEESGCFAVVLEAVPGKLAKRVSGALAIPVIGIGAGAAVDGQVLVLQDLLGLNTQFTPKFVRKFLNGAELIRKALNRYHEEVLKRTFPLEKESYE